MMGSRSSSLLPVAQCLPGRQHPISTAPKPNTKHLLKQTPLYLQEIAADQKKKGGESSLRVAMLGMGCFWCSENIYMRVPGVYSTTVGYAGGVTQNPAYEEVCTGQTNHNEVCRIVFDEKMISFRDILRLFWQNHDPTTPNRQGNDSGTQYRSGIYYYSEAQRREAEATAKEYLEAIRDQKGAQGKAMEIATEIVKAKRDAGEGVAEVFFLHGESPEETAKWEAESEKYSGVEYFIAENDHQQYDARGKRQYCGLRPLGVEFPGKAGVDVASVGAVGEACSRTR